MVSSFVKKLCRLCLSCPPHSIIYILALVYHLILKNPELRSLIHRVGLILFISHFRGIFKFKWTIEPWKRQT
jgi:hypothetical protein